MTNTVINLCRRGAFYRGLCWVPRGTHSWKKFIRPSELVRLAEAAELKAEDITGLILDPLTNEFRLTKSDLDVNYLFTCKN